MNSSYKIPVILLLFAIFSGCVSDSEGTLKIVEGIVFEDCDGNVGQNKIILLQNICNSSWNTEIVSEISTFTDNNGYYKFEYTEDHNEASMNHCYHILTIPNSLIEISNPIGKIDLFPSDTLMNAIIKLKFDTYVPHDTFYYQFKPSPKGIFGEPENIQYFVGPFNDTTLILQNLKIGSTNSTTKGEGYCGSFKWSIGKSKLNSYYTGHDGHFTLKHEPCAENDTIEYLVNPNY